MAIFNFNRTRLKSFLQNALESAARFVVLLREDEVRAAVMASLEAAKNSQVRMVSVSWALQRNGQLKSCRQIPSDIQKSP